ncbi:MAG: ABC transporter permease [Desulfuromonadales bacterium]|nr:ABC transporter permease [Desulfuromonadales bacterium]
MTNSNRPTEKLPSTGSTLCKWAFCRTKSWNSLFARLVFFILLICCWQLISTSNIWSELLFPSPNMVFKNLTDSMRDNSLPVAISASLKRLCVGYVISLFVGVPCGLLFGRVRWLDDTLGSLTLGLQALPSICWLPLAILWFGLSELSIIFVVVMGSLMSLTLSVRDGVKTIPRLYLKASRVMGATYWKMYLYVILPASLPSILSGAKLGWSFAWRSLMAAELLYVNVGLGANLMMGRELHDMGQVVATMIVIVSIGLCIDRCVFGLLEKAIHKRWGYCCNE